MTRRIIIWMNNDSVHTVCLKEIVEVSGSFACSHNDSEIFRTIVRFNAVSCCHQPPCTDKCSPTVGCRSYQTAEMSDPAYKASFRLLSDKSYMPWVFACSGSFA